MDCWYHSCQLICLECVAELPSSGSDSRVALSWKPCSWALCIQITGFGCLRFNRQAAHCSKQEAVSESTACGQVTQGWKKLSSGPCLWGSRYENKVFYTEKCWNFDAIFFLLQETDLASNSKNTLKETYADASGNMLWHLGQKHGVKGRRMRD